MTNQKEQQIKYCDQSGCEETGEYKAPKGRTHPQGYYYFCFSHVQEYNKNWDYFKGLSSEEIMMHRIADFTWRRPTRTFKDQRILNVIEGVVESPFAHGNFEKAPVDSPSTATSLQLKEKKALKVLGMSFPFTIESLKKVYIKLVKENHPDVNGGCVKLEEKLKQITTSYGVLMVYAKNHLNSHHLS